uniref:BRICHOS domain-containing protein C09F5.1 (projected from Caenorhabditis elegans ortholog C09F5.1) n=1 Tax=Strongyloides venezuelensis TaxID=75913 RepID=A0A0K0FEC5_STRVS
MEQIEIIETHITESRRPITDEEAINYRPYTEERSTSETFTTPGFIISNDGLTSNNISALNDIDSRYYYTGERDFSQDPSFLTSTSVKFRDSQQQNNITYDRDRSLNSTSGIQNFGYDINEVHTSEGGARIITHHGLTDNKNANTLSDDKMDQSNYKIHNVPVFTKKEETFLEKTEKKSLYKSMPYGQSHDEGKIGFSNISGFGSSNIGTRVNGTPQEYSYQNKSNSMMTLGQQTSPPLQGILKPERNSWQYGGQGNIANDDSSFTRKDSYKRMQESQQFEGSPSIYAPKSQTSLISNNTSNSNSVKWSKNLTKAKDGVSFIDKSKGCLSSLFYAFRDAKWTPKLICNLCLILTFIILGLIMLFYVLSALFYPSATRDLLLFPPPCEECLKRNPNSQSLRSPSHLYAHYYSPNQAHFELVGNPPLKSNSFTAIDFGTGYIAYADHALTNDYGLHTTCFLMQLDRLALPSMDHLMDALRQTKSEEYTQFGWQEYWQYETRPIDSRVAQSKFTSEINDCRNAKWIELKHTVEPRDESCSDCWDFCLPDYAIQRRQRYEDESIVGIRRLNCFRYYVPEWSKYSVHQDSSGGHWQYPRSPASTARDEHGEWVGWKTIAN